MKPASSDRAIGRNPPWQKHITAEPAVPQLIVTSEFAAPRDLLFRAYTDPELLVQWLGPRGLALTVDHVDTRHGGTWRIGTSLIYWS